MKASVRNRPVRSLASNARATLSGLRSSGFSQSTCFPASSALIDQSTWSVFGSGT
jgi:hypothetical protein